MVKFSIIVPIYNVEKYIDKCLNSIKTQTYENFEVILVNDGSSDKSIDIVSNYLEDERFKLYNKENGGLSSARNYGVLKSNGEYILFVDSDDYIDSNILENIYNNVKDNSIDLIRYGIYLENHKIRKTKHNCFEISNVDSVLSSVLEAEFVEPAWAYVYRSEFYKKNDFKFELNRYHEDFGLIPYIILKAEKILAINYYGYYYVIHENSIMTTKSKEKNEKKMEDTLYLFDQLLLKINNDKSINSNNKKIMKSFIANVIICRSKVVDNIDDYIIELKKRNLDKLLLNDTFLRKIKKIIFKTNPKFYIKKFIK